MEEEAFESIARSARGFDPRLCLADPTALERMALSGLLSMDEACSYAIAGLEAGDTLRMRQLFQAQMGALRLGREALAGKALDRKVRAWIAEIEMGVELQLVGGGHGQTLV